MWDLEKIEGYITTGDRAQATAACALAGAGTLLP
jgi:hypothetical protein